MEAALTDLAAQSGAMLAVARTVSSVVTGLESITSSSPQLTPSNANGGEDKIDGKE